MLLALILDVDAEKEWCLLVVGMNPETEINMITRKRAEYGLSIWQVSNQRVVVVSCRKR